MSTLNVSNITDGTTTVGTSYVVNGSAKVLCSVIYSGGTPTTSQSLNTSSLTDVSAGNCGFNVASSFSGSSYGITYGGNDNNYGNRMAFIGSTITSSFFRTVFIEGNSTTVEDDRHAVTAFGDLA